jgi:NTP pyrophosphatase (non-canonical NTP hydrolase)
MRDLALNEYQNYALEYAIYPRHHSIVYPALGLAGEAGEVLEHIKKMIRDDGETLTGSRRQALRKELGDVLWYLAALARDCNLTLDEIASENIEKLRSRALRGTLQGSGSDR